MTSNWQESKLVCESDEDVINSYLFVCISLPFTCCTKPQRSVAERSSILTAKRRYVRKCARPVRRAFRGMPLYSLHNILDCIAILDGGRVDADIFMVVSAYDRAGTNCPTAGVAP